ncbi:MAG TPA: hypothetical protein VFS21_16195 [Roseiflexaceae bacterium]|nr:hypothetical protein [Roseiflexaceae bacterium]
MGHGSAVQQKAGRNIAWNRLALVIGVLVAICVAAYLAFSMFNLGGMVRASFWNNDPQQAAQIGRELLDYSLPAGLQEQKYMDAQQTRMVLIAPASQPDDLQIVLVKPPLNLNDPEWSDEIEESWTKRIEAHTYTTQVVSTQSATIAGQPTELKIREGQDETGQAIRQVTGIIPGRSGSIVLVIVGKQAAWNQALVDQFLLSLA